MRRVTAMKGAGAARRDAERVGSAIGGIILSRMGVARDLEKRLEGLMEGFFTKVFRSGLQPVEVGRRILREMEENRTVSVNRTYAPNDFQVFIGPEDLSLIHI